jgi:signal transduction histidine kinase
VRHGRRARLRLQAPENAEDGIVLDLEDDGPGIPEDLLGRVCEPFFRVDDARSSPAHATPTGGAGVGLGLAIARSCVQAHGGTLTLSNLPQGGLRARIVLPL